MMKKFQEDRDVSLFCDFHGHSRRENVFMYGCANNKIGDLNKEKLFPNLLSKNCKIFSFDNCCFDIQKSKESTGRVVVWRELSIQNSYTIEASFCGADFEKYVQLHFNREMLEEVGHQFCETIYDFRNPDQTKIKKALVELGISIPDKDNDPDRKDSDEDSDWDSSDSDDENIKDEKKKKSNKKSKSKETVASIQGVSEDSTDTSAKKGLKPIQGKAK